MAYSHCIIFCSDKIHVSFPKALAMLYTNSMHIINRKIKKEILKSTVSFHEKQDIDCQFSPLFDLLFIGYD